MRVPYLILFTWGSPSLLLNLVILQLKCYRWFVICQRPGIFSEKTISISRPACTMRKNCRWSKTRGREDHT
ncbi:hypothetical protein BDV36DRAFT_261892 [Aspergillus pseudocaelatus]|uniref:Secreted protein n=1 Tax=Aspergillus pseudocaelatus TaxID=1825620 RepID=A0ABQ6WFA1_9EURO|nr:hypothetical protein BDV36DRAFT_261892 [Aspergillus pseudocaelatus]